MASTKGTKARNVRVSAQGQGRGGAAGLEKGQVASPPCPRPEPGLLSEQKPWREVVENVDSRAR